MTLVGTVLILAFLLVLFTAAMPLGRYMAIVYDGDSIPVGTKCLALIERSIYRLGGIAGEEMNWRAYAVALLQFNFVGIAIVFVLQWSQHLLPLNPQQLGSVAPDLALNTAVSFATNTNWQSYSGESTLSYLTQMLGLTVQNFVSAATGMAVLIALTRGLIRRESLSIGNFGST